MSLYEWITVGMALICGLGLPTGMFIYNSLHRQVEALWVKHDEMVKAREKTAAEHAAFQLEVSREYVTRELLENFERRMDTNFRDMKSDFKTGMEALTRAFETHRNEDQRRA